MSNKKPRLDLKTFAKINKLLKTNITIFVEGPTDVVFIDNFLKESEISKNSKVKIYPIESTDFLSEANDFFYPVSTDQLGGACGKVLKSSEIFKKNKISRSIFIVDSDIRSDEFKSSFSNVNWTDYPSIESYAFKQEVIDYIVNADFYDLIPESANYWDDLSFVLKFLYFLRLVQPMYHPIYEDVYKYFNSNDSYEYENWIKFVPEDVKFKILHKIENSGGDDRLYVYGHDIPKLFLSWHNKIINDNKSVIVKYSYSQFESKMTSVFAKKGLFVGETLFENLESQIQFFSMP